MGVKCPSCGFESPAEAAWCDFCKEPFRKKEKTPSPPVALPAQPVAPAPITAPAPPKGPRVRYRLPESISLQGPRLKNPEELPKEAKAKLEAALAMGDGEARIPAFPGWFRALAWLFLGVWFLTGMILGGIFLARTSSRDEAPPAAQP